MTTFIRHLTDLRLAREQKNQAKLDELMSIRNERFQLMEELAKLPKDMVFFTRSRWRPARTALSRRDAQGNIKGALVGVEAVTPEGLKAVFKDWNYSGEALARQLQTFKQHACTSSVRSSSACPDKPATRCHGRMALKAGVTFAQFVMMTPFPAPSIWEMGKRTGKDPMMVGEVPSRATGSFPPMFVPRCSRPTLHEFG